MSLPVTEDTPPDMLAGSMDLNVVLPNGKNVKMSIQRSTPMMDLLVQVTTANRLSPGNYSIQAMGDRGVLPYKPSTPIGTLDAFTIKIVDKKLNSHKKAPQMPQSFLNTFRLQVNLPRSQLFVARVTPDITLREILTHVCTEKNLDINKYEFRIPGNPDEILELDKTLGSYKIQELSLVNKNNRAVGGLLSSADILHVKSSKHRQNSVCDSSLSSGSLGSRSTSPVPVNTPRVPPQPPIRKKRRPAPKPPQISENESNEETKTPRPVLISHSRESSDSSGYHEASVLSESPTHGAPLGRSESTSPPDTLPRQSKLLPSQSFTNLATMQPPSRTRLTSSVSNASLSSNGRKKRAAPPPPPATYVVEEKMKSSTLPTSRAEERIISNVPFVAAENQRRDETLEVVEESNTKVESIEKSVENVSKLITETKVDVATVETETKPVVEYVDVSGKPIPKPRTFVGKGDVTNRKVSLSRSQTDSVLLCEENDVSEESETTSTSETLKNIKSAPKMGEGDDEERSGKTPTLERWRNVETLACLNDDEKGATKSAWLLGDPETSGEISPTDEQEHDSLNWQYQLPPPPTDFRDVHSPNCTEFGTVTITPEVFRDEVAGVGKDEEFRKAKDCQKSDDPKRREVTNKPSVMSELTNVPPDSWKTKEKSSSVTNLYLNEDSVNNRRVSSLSYSQSFTNELPMKSYKMAAYESYGAENNREDSYEKEIRYKNYKNLEKSLSMECIQTRSYEPENKAEEVFRRPVAPVQKKLKVAKRSASTYNNPAQRRSESDLDAETDNMEVLHQHFLDFLKEKKLSSDLNMKSLSVIRHILPKINGAGEKEKTEADCVDFNKPRVTTVPVQVVDFKRKTSSLLERKVKENVVIIEKERYDDGKALEAKPKPETDVKKVESVKKYSYHAPPSINFATWGERPKTQVFIKDEDYVTENEVTKKIEKKPLEETPKPIVLKKPNPLQFKKPGVKSNYEMFSALPKKKEVTSLTLIKMEEEEKMKRKMELKEPSRVPIVCGVELKKEFKDQQSNKSISVTEVTIKQEEPTRPSHSVSIYINGNQRGNETSVKSNMTASKPLKPNYTIPKKGTSLMPVVKGFRLSEEQNNQSHVNINKICNISSSSNNNNDDNNNNNGSSANNGFTVATDTRNESSAIYNQTPKHVNEVSLAPPPPPPLPIGLPKLKPVSARQIKPKTISDDPRGQLMEDIRNFRGFNSHKLKTAQ